MSYVELLESEMTASDQFTKDNFGLQVGDGFPEMAREVVKSEKLAVRLIIGLVMGSFSGQSIAEGMKKTPDGEKPDFGKLILKNLNVFDTPLALLYWGIQIGRKMERESVSALDQMDSH